MQKVVISILLALAAYSQDALAHSEHDKARFVATDGQDTGRCDNRARPCKTILYAAQHANKGDKILVAGGQYTITSDQELFYLLSDTLPVLGGFSRVDLFRGQNPNQYATFLTGIPGRYSESLSEQGFNVIVDQKGEANTSYAMGQAIVDAQNRAKQNVACVDGQADIYPCNNMSLLSHVPLSSFPSSPSSANDIWGHVDLNNNREYALIGLRNAIAAVDVTNPEQPTVVGSISGQSTVWRDIKVYQFFDHAQDMWRSYAYVTADGASEGTLIIDMTNLPDAFTLVDQDKTDSSAHNIYISNVDYSLNIANSDQAALLHTVGTNNNGGGFRSYSLKSPEALGLELPRTGAGRSDYSHDISSVSISDSRASAECPNVVNGECRVMLDFNENEVRLWDHTNSAAITELGANTYPNAAYVHSGWWSEDKQYVLIHDELDEQSFGLNTTVNIFEIGTLSQPQLVSTWTGPTRAIDHNGFVRGNRYYMSNYERGLTVLDITNPAQPVEAGFFDTYPVSDSASFNGAWGVYPFLPSGNILVSDINAGLFVVTDETINQSDAVLNFSQSTYSTGEGTVLEVEVSKVGNAAVSVAYETIAGSAGSSDFVANSGTLDWPAGDTTSRTISLEVNSDTDTDEVVEAFFVRLVNPQNGAALAAPSIARVNIEGAADPGTISANTRQARVRENQGSFTLDISRQGGADGAATVDFQLRGGNATANQDYVANSGTLSWADGESGAKTVTVEIINDTDNERNEFFNLQLANATNASLGTNARVRITIRDDEANQRPSADAGADLEAYARQQVSLLGKASDPEGRITKMQWTQVSGPKVRIRGAFSPKATFTAPQRAGVLTFSYTVTDEFGLTSSDTVRVKVIAN